MLVKSTLSFNQKSVQSVKDPLADYHKVSLGSTPAIYPKPSIVSIPSELSVEIKIKGLN
jgi:hypothetical protein